MLTVSRCKFCRVKSNKEAANDNYCRSNNFFIDDTKNTQKKGQEVNSIFQEPIGTTLQFNSLLPISNHQQGMKGLFRSLPRTLAPHDPSFRLSQISRQLAAGEFSSLNSPFAYERKYSSRSQFRERIASPTTELKMSSQPDHPTLLIPGPIEFDDAVLQSMSHYR